MQFDTSGGPPVCRNKAVFLDRDGVINLDHGYVYRREQFEFKPGIFKLCEAAQTYGYRLVVVTNQAGIARGYYSEADFLDLTDWMLSEFLSRRIRIERVYFCPYHPVHGQGPYKRDSPDRKPKPGMILRAQEELNIDLGDSIIIGDTLSDVMAGEAAGIPTRVLLRTGEDQAPVPTDKYHFFNSLDEIRERFFPATGVPSCPDFASRLQPAPNSR
jgi:D-glycero-D-manno-heptose 1,7-bisphosphate phosphatase